MGILAIANQKGGTSKTATAHNLAAVLADHGRRVLLVDMDPQSSLTRAVLTEAPAGATLADVMTGTPAQDAIYKAGALDIMPSDKTLARTERELLDKIGRENILKRALAPLGYDIVIIDCPPSLGLLTVNALTAAQGVIIPVQPQAQDLRGLALFLDTVEQVKQLNPALQVIGILPTFYDPRLTHHAQAIEAMRAAGLPVLDIQIRRSIRIAEAAGVSKSLQEHDPRNPQNESYIKLGKVVIKWLAKNKP